ncbi:MAG: O-methyltransferase [Egibacteraceae bacterium]
MDDDRTTAYLRAFGGEEGEALRSARARSEEADIPGVPPETGALLRWVAELAGCRHAAEIGGGGGYSGLWLLEGMQPRGVLTSIELDPGHQALAQRAFAEAGMSERVRLILGPALSVLPRLADRAYEVVFLDAVKAEYIDYLPHAKRMLRPGGLLVADNVLWSGRVADPSYTDDDTEGLRMFTAAVKDDPDFLGQIVPTGDGVLIAQLRGAAH